MLVASATPVLGAIRTVIDFDGTINHDQGVDAAWRTDWTLVRIDGRHVGGQPSVLEFPPFAEGSADLALPQRIAISYGEYRLYLAKLGKEGDVLGDLRTYPLFPDPLDKQRPTIFRPGYYRVSKDLTFERFRPRANPKESNLLEDFEAAFQRMKASRGTQRINGHAFPLFNYALTRTDVRSDVVVSTFRWHLDWEWERLWSRYWATGLLTVNGRKTSKPPEKKVRVHSLSGPDGLFYARQSMAERKAEVVSIEAAQLVEGPLRLERHEELSPDPVEAASGVRVLVNTYIAPEDDPVNVAAVGARMAKLSGELGYAQNVKFVLHNVGKESDLKGSRWPQRWTVFHHGFGRPALESEIAFWTGEDAADCKRMIAGDWTEGAK